MTAGVNSAKTAHVAVGHIKPRTPKRGSASLNSNYLETRGTIFEKIVIFPNLISYLCWVKSREGINIIDQFPSIAMSWPHSGLWARLRWAVPAPVARAGASTRHSAAWATASFGGAISTEMNSG